MHFRADDEFEIEFAGHHMGAHHACQRTFVGQCQGPITEPMGLAYQFLGMGGTTQEGEIAHRMEFGVFGRASAGHDVGNSGSWDEYCI